MALTAVKFPRRTALSLGAGGVGGDDGVGVMVHVERDVPLKFENLTSKEERFASLRCVYKTSDFTVFCLAFG